MLRNILSRLFRRGTSPLGAGVLLVSLFCSGASLAQESSRKVLAKTAPSYPELAKKMHLTGKVKVEININPAGAVTSAKLIGGNPVFELSAVEAVKQWKFEPAQISSKGVIVLEFSGD